MKVKKLQYHFIGLSLFISLFLGACGSREADATPTFSVELAQTLAVETFSAGQTQTAIAMPTSTSTPTETPMPSPTITLAATKTPGTLVVPGAGIQPTASCYSMAFVADVTIPDNTTMKPGQTFTKTWRVRNNGSCAWEVGSKLTFIGGNAMGAAAVTLDKAVSPGAETELSVAMTAPTASGSHRGNWRMANAAGTNFGDEVFVLIVVSGSASTSSTATGVATQSTATPTSTGTATDIPTNAP